MSTFGDLTAPKVDQAGPGCGDEFVYVDISSIDNQAKRIVDPKRLAPDAAPSRARQRLRKGDVLVSMTRPNLNAVAIVPHDLDGSIGSTGFHVLRATDGVDSHWLYYAVQSSGFVKAMCDLVQGALYPAVRPKDIREYSINPPTLERQREIVAELEKQFSRLDEAVANLQRVKANLKRYKASVLKAAVEGRLVETEVSLAHREGRTYETGEQLLQRVLEERRAKWAGRGKYKETVSPGTEALHKLPDGWAWCSCDQISSKITDGEHISPQTGSVGIPLLSAKDVLDTGVTFEDAKYVSAVDAEKFRSRCNPDRGDVLIVSRGATIGRACLVNSDLEFCLMGSVILMKPQRCIDPAYLLLALKAGFFQTRLTAVSGSTAQQAIYIRDIRPLQLPLPPCAEQIRIVAEVDRHLSIVREVEAEVDTNLKRAQALRQATLSKVFSQYK